VFSCKLLAFIAEQCAGTSALLNASGQCIFIPCFTNVCGRFLVLGNWPTWRTNSFQCIYLFI